MDLIFLCLACIFSIEIFLRLKFLSFIYSILIFIRKAFYVIFSSKISDYWKEIIVPKYAFIIFKKSLLALLLLLLIILVFSIFVLLSSSFLNFLISIKGILMSIGISFLYLKIRQLLIK
jgi:hypothetical protein